MKSDTAPMVVRCILLLVLNCGAVYVAADVHIEEDEAGAILHNQRYRVHIAAKRGMTLDTITDRRTNRALVVRRAGLAVVEDRERDEWTGDVFGQPQQHEEQHTPVTITVSSAPNTVTCTATWNSPAAQVEKTMVVRDGIPAIDLLYTVHVRRRLEQLIYCLEVDDAHLSEAGRFYPGAERYAARIAAEAHYRKAPGYAHCWDGETGLGVMAEQSSAGVDAISYMTCRPSMQRTHLAAHSPQLRWRKPPYTVRMALTVTLAADPKEIATVYRTRAATLKPVEVALLTVPKLIYRVGEPGSASVLLRNNTRQDQVVTLRPELTGGVRDIAALPDQRVHIRPLSDAAADLHWANTTEYGHELAVQLVSESGAVLDTAREVFAVADHFVNVGQTTVWNPGWMNEEWLIPAMVTKARECYVGVIEYYCWAPDQVFDLTPDTETWEPHTESQRAYRTTLTRSFLKNVVRTAHENGLRVLAMDTGFTSLAGALRHPERVKYTADGQIYLYNGNIHDGRRFNAVGAHMFEPEYVNAWANEMCRSVDMFGWDGVRFDWNFIPCAPQDPLQAATVKQDPKTKNPYIEARKQAWYTVDGRRAQDLYPDPDATAAALCRQYRETVARNHPNFIYNVNYSVNLGMLDDYPRYSEVNCRDSGILMESLLNTARTYPTWQAWAEILTGAMRHVRPYRAQPFVGFMRGYAPGGVAHRTMQFVMMAAGFRWYGSHGARHSLDDSYRRFRHATRFAEFFYDPDFTPLTDPQPVFQLTGDGVERVLWKPFGFIRTRGDRREILVHLVNLPEDDYIIMHHDPPAIKHGLSLAVTYDDGYSPTDCCLIEPEPYPHAVPLTWKPRGQDTVTIDIPRLDAMASVIFTVDRQ